MVNFDRPDRGVCVHKARGWATRGCVLWLVLGLAGCNARSEEMWQQRAAESQAKIDHLSSQVTELQGKVRESTARLEERDQKIAMLESETRNRAQLIEKLEVDTKNLRMQVEALQKQSPAPK